MAGSKSGAESASEDDTKRKFREALERKNAKSSGGADHKDGGGQAAAAHGRGGEPPGVPPQERLSRLSGGVQLGLLVCLGDAEKYCGNDEFDRREHFLEPVRAPVVGPAKSHRPMALSNMAPASRRTSPARMGICGRPRSQARP